ncbi:DUF6463 family protein [Paenibacillus sp.]|uniref:DUF6463 family protein n=1 Tax=Paenibacillus sp. TaxID=58172 RepID=UPI002811CD8D|nr:DUF6463 family protein [Paenibacillus sp.]
MGTGIKRQVGLLLALTGLLHSVVGLILYGDALLPIATEGLWNTMQEGDWERLNAFWFMMFGFLLMLIGYIVSWVLKQTQLRPPTVVGWSILAIGIVGAVIMPISGFWLVLPQAWLLLRGKSFIG